MELSLFRVKSFAAGIAVQTVFGVALGVFFLVWTLYMQFGLGWSPLRAGLTGVPFSIAVSTAAGISVQTLVPRFGRKVLQTGALVMAAGVLLYMGESGRYGLAITSWQMALPLVVMGLGMGLIVAPLTDAVLSQVPREHAGAASGLINTVQQMGNALGLGLVSVVFFGTMSDRLTPDRIGPAYVDAFQNALGWVAAVMAVIFLLMFALPRRRPSTWKAARPRTARRSRSPRWSETAGARRDGGQDGWTRGGSGTGVPDPPFLMPDARSCLLESECFCFLFTFRTTRRSLRPKPQVRAWVGGERSCTHRSGSRRSSGSPETAAGWTWCRWPRSSR